MHPADGRTAVAFAGTVGLALDMTKLYQGELAHSEKMEGIPMTLSARAARLAAMIRQHLGQAVRGLAVAPLPAGHDPTAPTADAAGSSPTTPPAACTRRPASTPRAPAPPTPGAR
ncbi:hypothetical protein GCM10010259_02360 [Streptomyces daghestanicus]|uniref:Uncharacterized protein n=1 Tax=Streptomyces daghestanicus TaxID=66885 RepID=A0ABQ3QD46_9ACTN|nr:hypothetical protein GCM10010259_02360 [Streptomyces daghestanicus]GHI35218.1 hypothetical protein Sdagh_69480 [Streptomyces daghestanicus]